MILLRSEVARYLHKNKKRRSFRPGIFIDAIPLKPLQAERTVFSVRAVVPFEFHTIEIFHLLNGLRAAAVIHGVHDVRDDQR